MHISSYNCRLLGFLSILIVLALFAHSDKIFMSSPYKAPDRRCVERNRIAFVKVHRAASTTITSILQRFGYTRNLTFALPRQNSFHIGFTETFHPDNVMSIPNGSVYEIVCQHVVFNKEAFKRYLPPDINIIAAVREPTDRFVSSFMYFFLYSHRVKALGKSDIKHDPISLMREFLRDPELYEPDLYKSGPLALNRMSFDFGLPKEQYFNNSFVMEYIKLLDDSMTFVLVADRFDESLVILKRRLCWSTKDIIYKAQHKGGTRPKLPADLKEALVKLTPSDYKIYEYFSKKFNEISLQEARLQDEVAEFKNTIRIVSLFCGSLPGTTKQDSTIHFDATAFSEGFDFDKNDCMSLDLIEKEFVKKLVSIQVPKEKHREFHGWNN